MTTTPDSPPPTTQPQGAHPFETTFDALPPNARVWVLAASRPLEGTDRDAVLTAVEKGYHVWRMKAPGARGCHEIRDGWFLVVKSLVQAFQ